MIYKNQIAIKVKTIFGDGLLRGWGRNTITPQKSKFKNEGYSGKYPHASGSGASGSGVEKSTRRGAGFHPVRKVKNIPTTSWGRGCSYIGLKPYPLHYCSAQTSLWRRTCWFRSTGVEGRGSPRATKAGRSSESKVSAVRCPLCVHQAFRLAFAAGILCAVSEISVGEGPWPRVGWDGERERSQAAKSKACWVWQG